MILNSSRKFVWVVITLALSCSTLLMAQEKPVPVAYDLKVSIEPEQGYIAVRGKVEVPLQNPHAGEWQFALHETLAVKELSVNGRRVDISYRPAETSPITPAQRNVVVNLP